MSHMAGLWVGCCFSAAYVLHSSGIDQLSKIRSHADGKKLKRSSPIVKAHVNLLLMSYSQTSHWSKKITRPNPIYWKWIVHLSTMEGYLLNNKTKNKQTKNLFHFFVWVLSFTLEIFLKYLVSLVRSAYTKNWGTRYPIKKFYGNGLDLLTGELYRIIWLDCFIEGSPLVSFSGSFPLSNSVSKRIIF